MAENAKPASNFPLIVAMDRAGLIDWDRFIVKPEQKPMRPADRFYAKPNAEKK